MSDLTSDSVGASDTERRSGHDPAQQAQPHLPLAFGHGNLRTVLRTCIYCGNRADTRDHVPPKTLLLRPYPLNLRTVPACAPCNAGWSLDEQYVAVVIAYLSENPRLRAQLDPGNAIDRALIAAPMLDDRITNCLSEHDGRVCLTPELHRIAVIAEKTARGLFALRYGPSASTADFTTLRIFGPGDEIPQRLIAAMHYWPGIRRKRWTAVQGGIFSFLFTRGWFVDDPPLLCLIDLADTLLVAVACPPPVGKSPARRLRAKTWK